MCRVGLPACAAHCLFAHKLAEACFCCQMQTGKDASACTAQAVDEE